MSSRLEEIKATSKIIDPIVLQTILLDEMCGRLEELGEKMDKLGAWVTFMGPMTRMFKPELQYQYKTVEAGGSATVYKLDNPERGILVGIITQVANDWYPDTFLEWYIDYKPKRVDYVIGQMDAPKEYERGIPFHHEVKWVAHNKSDEDHVFGVLCDGFFVDKRIYKRIVGI